MLKEEHITHDCKKRVTKIIGYLNKKYDTKSAFKDKDYSYKRPPTKNVSKQLLNFVTSFGKTDFN